MHRKPFRRAAWNTRVANLGFNSEDPTSSWNSSSRWGKTRAIYTLCQDRFSLQTHTEKIQGLFQGQIRQSLQCETFPALDCLDIHSKRTYLHDQRLKSTRDFIKSRKHRKDGNSTFPLLSSKGYANRRAQKPPSPSFQRKQPETKTAVLLRALDQILVG